MQKVAPLSYGVIFKKAFSPVDTFTAFVRDILSIELQINQVETEKFFDKPKPIGLEKKETTLHLLAKGMSAEVVAKVVDLPLEVVQTLLSGSCANFTSS